MATQQFLATLLYGFTYVSIGFSIAVISLTFPLRPAKWKNKHFLVIAAYYLKSWVELFRWLIILTVPLTIIGCLQAKSSAEALTFVAALVLLCCGKSLVYYQQITTFERIQELNKANAIFSMTIADENNQNLSLWLKRHEDWPPVIIELGLNGMTISIEKASDITISALETMAKKGNYFQNPKLYRELKQKLNEEGVTHPIDISGSSKCPAILEFIERVLLI